MLAILDDAEPGRKNADDPEDPDHQDHHRDENLYD